MLNNRKKGNKKSPKLPLNDNEKISLRREKIKLSDISCISPEQLAKVINSPVRRCMMLVALSKFQDLSSVGPSLAKDIYDLGIMDLEQLKKSDPTKMYNKLSSMRGSYIDPCVEDVFRCAVVQAKYPNLPAELKQWWFWSDKRGKHVNEKNIELAIEQLQKKTHSSYRH